MALWSGRFEKGVSEFTQEFGASLPVDKAMYHQDIAGSRAHARMLAAQGVISQEDADAIVAGLSDIEKTIEEGNFVFDINDEDIHMSIEKVTKCLLPFYAAMIVVLLLVTYVPAISLTLPNLVMGVQ